MAGSSEVSGDPVGGVGHRLIRPACASCGKGASCIELVPPGDVPSGWDGWPAGQRRAFVDAHDGRSWLFIYQGLVAGNGLGDDLSAEEAARYAEAFAEPLSAERVAEANLYDNAGFCLPCGLPYCADCWGATSSGYGRCPQGHGKSLDPHWSP